MKLFIVGCVFLALVLGLLAYGAARSEDGPVLISTSETTGFKTIILRMDELDETSAIEFWIGPDVFRLRKSEVVQMLNERPVEAASKKPAHKKAGCK